MVLPDRKGPSGGCWSSYPNWEFERWLFFIFSLGTFSLVGYVYSNSEGSAQIYLLMIFIVSDRVPNWWSDKRHWKILLDSKIKNEEYSLQINSLTVYIVFVFSASAFKCCVTVSGANQHCWKTLVIFPQQTQSYVQQKEKSKCTLVVCFNLEPGSNRCGVTNTLPCSLAGPCSATSFHPRQPHSQDPRGSPAALRVRGLYGHAPAVVRQLPAQRRLPAVNSPERPCIPRRASRTCSQSEGGRGRAGEAGEGAGKHVHPPRCGAGSGSQHGLHSAAAGNTWWAELVASLFIKLAD